MCDICKSMLAAEHTERTGAEICPKCRRFPLDAEFPLDLNQWDYVAPEFKNSSQEVTSDTPDLADCASAEAPEFPEDAILEEVEDEPDEHARTCYHCYQIDSGSAEPCPVCGESYLPPAMRQPHAA